MADRVNRFNPPWHLLTDDIWTLVIAHLTFRRDKLRVQQTCQRFHDLLANPTTTTIWGKVVLPAPKGRSDAGANVWRLCSWVQRRLKGISALGFIQKSGDTQQQLRMDMMWHAPVAATAGTGIRLKLTTYINSFPHMAVLKPPSRTELVQRLTSLIVEVVRAADITVVHSLAALRHLLIGCSPNADMHLLQMDAHDTAEDSQLVRLRTLHLSRLPPVAFIRPGTAACLQQLRALALHECPLPNGSLPPELLRLPSLSWLELILLLLRMMPDLCELPALQELIMSRKGCAAELDASQAECSAELRDALRNNPLGGAMGLTKVVLHAMPITTQECAEAIARLPDLQVLGLDFGVSVRGAFWAATVQQRMAGRCSVESASKYVDTDGSTFLSHTPWPNHDW